MTHSSLRRAIRGVLLVSASAALASPAVAQEAPRSGDGAVQEVVVTGSRIVRRDYDAPSPVATVTAEQVTRNADVTLDTFLNTLPQAAPAATTTSNNPSNGGQSNINLRGLGPNRNIVLIDGRRAMVSDSSLQVDLNTIPAAMIETVEVVTGGAGAAYGADAVAGAVNIRLKKNFSGIDVRTSYSDSEQFWDAKEYTTSIVAGGQFAEGRGHAIFGYDHSYREAVTKGQREFSAFATSTTGVPPQGVIRWTGANPIPLPALQTVFAGYGVAPGAITNQSGAFGFNQDGTLFFAGIAGNPALEVQNFRDPLDLSVNSRYYPDFYSYNFDAPNILQLPLDRDSFMFDMEFEVGGGVDFFAQAGWTQYESAQALAPVPAPTVSTVPVGTNTATQVGSPLVSASIGNNFIVPVTNPFIPADLAFLLSQRTGDDTRIVGSGATEPFLYGVRPTAFGLRQSNFENSVIQYTGGFRGPIWGLDNWDWELSFSSGRTKIENQQTGNIETQRMTNVLANPLTTGNGVCATWNPFGVQPIPGACLDYLAAVVSSATELKQQIIQGFVRGSAFELPAGSVDIVVGAERRNFDYSFAYRGAPGPFSGFNVGDPDAGYNEFEDIFTEALIPIVSDAPFAQSIDIGLGYRYSRSQFVDEIQELQSDKRSSDAYKLEANWALNDSYRFRASYQRSVREPNFTELFSSSLSFPQIFDPCSVTSNARQGPNAAALAALCQATGVANIGTFAATPGAQAQTVLDGNVDLEPEKADTITFGFVFGNVSDGTWLNRLRGSIDYYSIDIEDPIILLNTNVGIAECYNYYGNNPSYTVAGSPFCEGLVRNGGVIQSIVDPTTGGAFLRSNGGKQETSGIDFQLDYGFDFADMGAPDYLGNLNFNLLLTHVMSFEQSDAANLPLIDYTGTISFFGAGLGTSFPDFKAVLGTTWTAGPAQLSVRGRWTDGMENRIKALYPGETDFGGGRPDVGSTTYWDVIASYTLFDSVTIRAGLNNAFDKQPPLYAPNVQSGTDPSIYDVIGRRAFAQVNFRF